MKKYENFANNLSVLSKANGEDLTNEFIIGGIIDKFFIQFELGWKLWKELLKYEGVAKVATGSPREIIKEAYKYFDFMDAEIWLDMLKSRNDMTHIYNGKQARALVDTIIKEYIPEFQRMQQNLIKMYGEHLADF